MFGRMLKVDLTTGSISAETIPAAYLHDYIGAAGLGARLLVGRPRPRAQPARPGQPAALHHRAADRHCRPHHRALCGLRALAPDRLVG